MQSYKMLLCGMSILGTINYTQTMQVASELLTKRALHVSPQHLQGLRAILGSRFKTFHPQPIAMVDNRPAIVKKRLSIFLPGFLNNNAQASDFYKQQCLSGDTLTFNFPDVDLDGQGWATRASFAQENDVLTAIYMMNQAYDQRLFTDAVDLWGYSRGGATAGNTIHVLASPTKKQSKQLSDIGIDDQRRKLLLASVQAGTVILDRPLISLTAALQTLSQHHAKQFTQKVIQLTRQPSLHDFVEYLGKNPIAATAHSAVFYTFALLFHYLSVGPLTRFSYSPFGLNLWESSETIKKLGIKTLLHFQHKDFIVSNEYDMALYQKMAHGNPQHTYVSFGKNGGHQCNPADLLPFSHTFRQKYGGSYDPNFVVDENKLSEVCQPALFPPKKF